MAAMPGTREYGILSIITQLFSEVKVFKTLSPQVFWPRPEVYSALVKISVNKEKYAGRITDYSFLKKSFTPYLHHGVRLCSIVWSG